MSKPRRREVAAEEGNIGSLQGDHSHIYILYGVLTVIGNLTKQERNFSTHPRNNRRTSSILLEIGTEKQDPHHVYLSNEFTRIM